MNMQCQCLASGYCPVFNRDMNSTLHSLCQENSERGEKYRKLWTDQRDLHRAPNLIQKATNFAAAVAKHALDLGTKVSEEILKQRLDICSSCERLSEDKSTCNECGCPVETKASWRSEDCPLKKWAAPPPGGWSQSFVKRGCGGCGS